MALSRIRALTFEVEKRRLMAIDPQKTYYLEDFVAFQRGVQDQLRTFLQNFSLQVHNEVSDPDGTGVALLPRRWIEPVSLVVTSLPTHLRPGPSPDVVVWGLRLTDAEPES